VIHINQDVDVLYPIQVLGENGVQCQRFNSMCWCERWNEKVNNVVSQL